MICCEYSIVYFIKCVIPTKIRNDRRINLVCVLCLVSQSCPTFCDLTDCSPPGSSVHGDSPGNNTGVGCHALLQGIFPTQGSNPRLPHCRWSLHHLSHQGSPNFHICSHQNNSAETLWFGKMPTNNTRLIKMLPKKVYIQSLYMKTPEKKMHQDINDGYLWVVGYRQF